VVGANWTVTGTYGQSNPWTVQGGTLNVTGNLAAATSLTVTGGTLMGTGTVGATQINSGGTFAPGFGTPGSSMTVAGNLGFAPGAIYMVQLNPTTASFAAVNGITTIGGGTVNAVFAPGSYLARQYTILTSTGGLSGTFAGLTNTNLPSGFTDSLSYGSASAFLNLTAALGLGTPGLNGNQTNVANALNNFFNTGGALPPGFVGIFGLTGGALQNALTQIDGEPATDAEKGAFGMMTQFMTLMLDPFVDGRGGPFAPGGAIGFAPAQQASSFPPDIALAYAGVLKAPPPASFNDRWTAWGSGFGGYNTTRGEPTVGSTNVVARTYGFAAGMDYRFAPNALAGFALAGGGTNWSLAQGLGGGRSDAFQAGVYAKTFFGPAYIGGSLAFANHWMTTSRTALAGDQLTASFNGQSFGARAEAGYRVAAAPTIGVTPYAAVQVQTFHTPSFAETDVTGGGFGLAFNAMNATDTRSELGARFDDVTTLAGLPLVLRGRLAWAHDWVSNPALGAVFQALPGQSFIVNGAALPQNSALTSASAQLYLTRNWSLAAKFDGEFASGSQTYAGTGTLRFAW
jgi:uncharacterized protein with beta-barrel porin domain